MNKQYYELTHIHDNQMDDIDEEIDLGNLYQDKHHHRSHARRSVDDYLESKRLREQYRSLFDEDFKDI